MPGITKLASEYSKDGLNVLLFPTDQVTIKGFLSLLRFSRASEDDLISLRWLEGCYIYGSREFRLGLGLGLG